MVSFEIFVKSMTPSLLELKVTPSFCFAFKIPDDVTATTTYTLYFLNFFEVVSRQNNLIGMKKLSKIVNDKLIFRCLIFFT